jgi:DinB superfamily
MAEAKADSRVVLLLDGLDEAFEGRSWHGPNLRGSVRGLRARQAEARPQPGRHNIYELTVHAAYWKYVVWRRLTGGDRGSFALSGSNYFPCPSPLTEAAWKDAVALLVREHRRLRQAVAGLPASALGKVTPGGRETTVRLIRGIAAHDLYHAGQIQLLKRLIAG